MASGEDALELFYKLEEPDEVSFIAALSACGHGGLVEDGIKIFNSMKDFNVTPREANNACMVDLLARSGRIEQALELAKTMPVKASAEMRLGEFCLEHARMHSDLEAGFYTGAQMVESGSMNSGYYVLLSNTYAGCRRCEDVELMRGMMKEKGVKKGAGCSWMEVDKGFHCFAAERAQHPEWERMFRVLSFLNEQMRGVCVLLNKNSGNECLTETGFTKTEIRDLWEAACCAAASSSGGKNLRAEGDELEVI